MRHRIYEIIEVAQDNDKWSHFYDIFMMVIICLSLFPLAFKEQTELFEIIDKVTVTIFIMDYFMRIATADYKLKNGTLSFIQYPFSFLAIIDLLSILPSLILMNSSLRLLKVFRLIKTFRVFRVFKTFRYSKNIQMVLDVFQRQKDSLTVVCVLAGGYILISALIIFNIEPDTFNSFFDAIYWATVSLTTVGYGDIFATSTVGKVITMISSVFGIAIVALPAGIITAGYMEEINKNNDKNIKKKESSS